MNQVRWIALGAALTLAIFYATVIFSGAGWNPIGIEWNFENSGQFGDSFGPLSTLMAGVAAVSALAAYLSQREELHRIKADSAIDRSAAFKRDFEQTFFNLLQLLRETVKEIDVADKYGLSPLHGRDALKRILEEFIGKTRGDADLDKAVFLACYKEFRDDLAHYFRLLYHIVLFVHRSSVDDKMLYIRLLRATLSNAEIVLLALNCLYGGGRQKFKPLVERYALLHNISTSDAKDWRIIDSFSQEAFGDRSFSESDREFAH